METALLQSIYLQSRRSIRSIDRLQRRGAEGAMQLQREEYAQIAREAARLLTERGQPLPRQQLLPLPYPLGNAPFNRRRRDSLRDLNRRVRSVAQMQVADPKVAALNRRLLLVCHADATAMRSTF